MGIFASLRSAAKKLLTLSSSEGWENMFNLGSLTGINITPEKAIRNTAVLRSIAILSETVAQLPLRIIDRDKKKKVDKHPLSRLLNLEVNANMSAFDFWAAIIVNVLMFGNGIAEIERNGKGEAIGLWLWRSDKVTLLKDNQNGLWYRYTSDNPEIGIITIPSRDILHIKGFNWDGLWGKTPIQIAREAIGLSLATEDYGASFFGSGGQPSGVLQTDSKLQPDSIARLKNQWKDWINKSDKLRTLVLEEGLKYNAITLAPNDSQFIETRKFQVSEIARMFGVPPHMLADLERATFANIEHQNIEFVTFTLLPWIRRIEKELTRKLITLKEQSNYYSQFNVAGLLRGDTKSRFESYAIGKNAGFLCTNDIRELEDLPPVEGGNVFWSPVNTMPADLSEAFWASKITTNSKGVNKSVNDKEPTGKESDTGNQPGV